MPDLTKYDKWRTNNLDEIRKYRGEWIVYDTTGVLAHAKRLGSIDKEIIEKWVIEHVHPSDHDENGPYRL